MTDCKWALEQLALLVYGELSFDAEERVETHLDACPECRAALQREKAMQAAFDSVEVAPSPSLLRECRENLRLRLMEEAAPASAGWWERLVDAIALRPSAGMLRPAGALTLIALGFFGARLMPAIGSAGPAETAALFPESRVRYVEPAADGRVQIVVDETRQRTVSGRLDDQQIRGLLLAAVRDPSDPGLRAETVEILNSRAQAADVRRALIFALQDRNAGVREKAIDGLTPYAEEPDVRGALTQVLLSDSNPGMRTKAIDLLTRGTPVDRQLIGTLQELMLRGEQLGYVRERCRRVLESMNASAETY